MPEVNLKLVREEENEPERKCKDWLEDFGRWTIPRSESPHTLIFWSALFTLASVVRRHVKIPSKYLGGWDCYPFIYTIFVGEQGVIKKSTCIGFAEKILDAVKEELNLFACPEAVTAPELIKRLSDADDSSIYMVLSEFSLLPLKAGFGIYDTLTKLFDGAKKIDESTLSRSYILAINPCVNMAACTTPKWVAANMSEDILGGGFGSRVIFIHEKEPSKYGLFWDEDIARLPYKLDELEANLVHDLKIIAKIEGEFEIPGSKFDPNTPKGWMEKWYGEYGKAPKGTDDRMRGFYARRPAYVFKIAMLTHLAKSSDLILSMEDFERGIHEMDKIEEKVKSTYANIGKNPYAGDMRGILQYVKDNPGCGAMDIKAAFQHAAQPRILAELITGLIESGLITGEYDDKIQDYHFKAI